MQHNLGTSLDSYNTCFRILLYQMFAFPFPFLFFFPHSFSLFCFPFPWLPVISIVHSSNWFPLPTKNRSSLESGPSHTPLFKSYHWGLSSFIHFRKEKQQINFITNRNIKDNFDQKVQTTSHNWFLLLSVWEPLWILLCVTCSTHPCTCS